MAPPSRDIRSFFTAASKKGSSKSSDSKANGTGKKAAAGLLEADSDDSEPMLPKKSTKRAPKFDDDDDDHDDDGYRATKDVGAHEFFDSDEEEKKKKAVADLLDADSDDDDLPAPAKLSPKKKATKRTPVKKRKNQAKSYDDNSDDLLDSQNEEDNDVSAEDFFSKTGPKKKAAPARDRKKAAPVRSRKVAERPSPKSPPSKRSKKNLSLSDDSESILSDHESSPPKKKGTGRGRPVDLNADSNTDDDNRILDRGKKKPSKITMSDNSDNEEESFKNEKSDESDFENNDMDINSDDDRLGDSDGYESPPAKPKRAPARKGAAKGKATAAKGRKKAAPKSPSSPKRKRKPAAVKPKKEPAIVPSLELDSFDIDSCKVPECLEGKTFVFTGIMDGLAREEAIDIVKSLGGRVTGSVSSRTTYLVVGEILEDGRGYQEGSKYKKASELETLIILGAKKFYGVCQLYQERVQKDRGIEPSSEPTKVKKDDEISTIAVTSASVPVNPYAKKPSAVVNPYAKKEISSGVSNPYTKANPYAKASPDEPLELPKKSSASFQLWVDKYAPTSTRDILGNKDNISKLTNWLSTWERTFNNPGNPVKSFTNPKGPWKAALLSGPPGIGKTTTATLVAKEAGRDLVEFNASDARSKKALQDNLGDITGSQTLNFGVSASCGKKTLSKLRCIIMDEVDGMGAGDRSGMAELIQMIKNSKVPIICICNDRQQQKIKSLVSYCMDLRFKRPIKSIMAQRAVRVAEEEGLIVERNAAEAIAESCGNDVRQVLNCLQMWANRTDGSTSLTYHNLKEREHAIRKDEVLRISLFDAAKTLLEGRRGLTGADEKAQNDNLFRRSDAFFVDYSFTGLIVQQNYLKVLNGRYTPLKRDGNSIKEQELLDEVHSAAATISDFALVEDAIRGGDQNWGLLPTLSMLAVKTGYHSGGQSGSFFPGFPEFTTWMGRNSSKGKKERILNDLQHHMNYKISGGRLALRLDYLPALRQQLYTLLSSKGDGTKTEAMTLMDHYGLSREDVMESMDEYLMDRKSGFFGDIDSKQKAAFTREYNKVGHKSQALVSEQGGKSDRKRSSAKIPIIGEDGGYEDESGTSTDDNNDDDDDEGALKKLQEKFKTKRRQTSAGKKPAANKTTAKGRARKK